MANFLGAKTEWNKRCNKSKNGFFQMGGGGGGGDDGVIDLLMSYEVEKFKVFPSKSFFYS